MSEAGKEIVVVVASGGLDSSVLAYELAQNYRVQLLSYDYGQRHRRELDAAKAVALQLGVHIDIVDIHSVGKFLTGSALTDASVEVPHGHYEAESMRSTVVPNRNAIFLTIAYGVAISRNAMAVATAVHAGDHHIYPDCRPSFAQAFEAMQALAMEGIARPDLQLLTPYINVSKTDIVRRGHRLDVPMELTWSCYEGGEVHCGQCGTCVERKEAFKEADIEDPTQYRS